VDGFSSVAGRIDGLTVDNAGAVGLPICRHLVDGRPLGIILPLGF
jgi:hypothetical protein